MIRVLTNQPLRQLHHRPEASGRLLKWSIELSQFDIIYQPRATIKGKALADFVVECKGLDEEKDDPAAVGSTWKLYVDGASNDHYSRAGVVLITPEGHKICYALKLDFGATNNEAEYESLIHRLKIAKEIEVRVVRIYIDSQLVMNQVLGEFQTKGVRLATYLAKVMGLLDNFEHYMITHVPQEKNVNADTLAKFASSGDAQAQRIMPVVVVSTPSIQEADSVMEIEYPKSWMIPIKAYLEQGVLTEDKKEARKLVRTAPRYLIQNGVLYSRGFTTPLL